MQLENKEKYLAARVQEGTRGGEAVPDGVRQQAGVLIQAPVQANARLRQVLV